MFFSSEAMSPCWLNIESLTRWPGSGFDEEKNFDTVLLGQRMVSLPLNSHTNLIYQNIKTIVKPEHDPELSKA